MEHVSFWLDIKIIFTTVFKVFTNADNENKGATVVAKPQDSVVVAEEQGAVTQAEKIVEATENTEKTPQL